MESEERANRELAARIAQVNKNLGEVTTELMSSQDPSGIRELSRQLGDLAAAMIARAQKLAGSPVGLPGPYQSPDQRNDQ